MKGSLTVITGPMFSGKSTELIHRLRMHGIIRSSVGAFKSSLDDRYNATDITTHSNVTYPCITVSNPKQLLEYSTKHQYEVMGLDEAQFLGDTLPPIIQELVQNGTQVYIAGLSRDARNRPFGVMPQMLEMADQVIHLSAKCSVCEAPATHTYRSTPLLSTISVGASEYEARCESCWSDCG